MILYYCLFYYHVYIKLFLLLVHQLGGLIFLINSCLIAKDTVITSTSTIPLAYYTHYYQSFPPPLHLIYVSFFLFISNSQPIDCLILLQLQLAITSVNYMMLYLSGFCHQQYHQQHLSSLSFFSFQKESIIVSYRYKIIFTAV